LVLLEIINQPSLTSDGEWRVSNQREANWTSRSFSDDHWSVAHIMSSYTAGKQPRLSGLVWEREIIRKYRQFWSPIKSRNTVRNATSREAFPFVAAPIRTNQEVMDIVEPRSSSSTRATTPTKPTTPTKSTTPTRAN
jgi:hypothetical protein